LFNRIVERLMGQAAEGQRKMVYGTLALVLAWVNLMWGPVPNNLASADFVDLKASAARLVWYVVGVVITGNVLEWGARKFGKTDK